MIEQPPSLRMNAQSISKAFSLMNSDEGRELIQSINEKYLYWDKVKYRPISEKYGAVDLWHAVKVSRSVHAKQLRFGNYSFIFNTTDWILQVLHEIDLNFAGTLGATGAITEEDKQRYLISSIMEEAIASSQMEGASTTRKKAKEMLRNEEKPRNKSDQMIVNNYNTIRHIVQNKQEKLTLDRLLEVHALMAYNTLDDKLEEGCFRTTNDIYVVNHSDSEVVHTPPHFKDIPQLIDGLCDFFNNDNPHLFIHPIVKGIIIHFMMGYIHPFTDGNGRTARALFYWYLLSKGYWMTEYLSISRLIAKSKNQYEKAYLYTENDGNDLTYFITYNLKTMSLAYAELKSYIERKVREKQSTVVFQKLPLVNERQAEILRLLYNNGDLRFTVKEIQNRFIVSNQTARTDLQGLMSIGYLDLVQVNGKKTAFIKGPKFVDLLNE
ncbi:Fic family protein [uncultured Acetobacteroides sp.]|uniref:Fic family protein n=1 Tax=uncultured Acetobacteroides sp. TaxID=1760811 RepID=UPI0029F45A5C|nr:Fic family protein [uncultured Acetobacteroides sp.]